MILLDGIIHSLYYLLIYVIIRQREVTTMSSFQVSGELSIGFLVLLELKLCRKLFVNPWR